MNMKKHFQFSILLTFTLPIVCIKASAYHIAVENSDGVTIYYNYSSDGTELIVTSGPSHYFGNIVIPDEVTYMNRTRKVTSIESEAFKYCGNLNSVTIGNNVTSIGDNAFANCKSLNSVTMGNNVTSIGEGAFWKCESLTSVTIPNGVSIIGMNAFYECFSLSSVILSNGLLSIGSSAFYNCKRLLSITIPNSVMNIGDKAFWGCGGLKSVTMGNGLITISSSAFEYCRSLSSVNLPNSIKIIGEGAFSGCSNLTSINIPNSVTSIYPGTFKGCSSLTSITIPNNITCIQRAAFHNCSGLTSIIIPNSVSIIEEAAFKGCSNLRSVISFINYPFEIEGKNSINRTFDLDIFNNVTLYVPEGTIDDYKSTAGWKDFLFIEEGVPSCIDLPNNSKEFIQIVGGIFTIEGLDVDTQVNIYAPDGTLKGSSISYNGFVTIPTLLPAGSVAIVKIGQKAVKVIVK